MLQMAATIRTGRPAATFDYASMTPDALNGFFHGLHSGAVRDAQRLMEHDDFSAYNTLLDAGGGSGGLAITIAQSYPHLQATVADLPSVTPVTEQFINEAQAADQVGIITADAVRGPLSGSFDVIVARHFLQVLSEDDNRSLLKNLAAVMKLGGVIHLIGWMLDNSRLSPQKTVNYNLVLLNGYENGQAYTEQETFGWLTEASFADFTRIVFPDGESILTARKL
jgi:cyclopropane fatty-acyl-phospholipid synthase-like methyltransferase